MLTLLLALHDHQPVGNFDHVLRRALERCYRPVLDELARHPHVKSALHLSGPLIDWLEANEKSFLADVTALARTGQLEILGGAYFEPILPAIPPDDAAGQIRMMQDYWHARTGVRPAGLWVAERVWDPSLPALLGDAGVAYTLLDDAHFRAAGLFDRPLGGWFVTERAGRSLAVFPIDRELRYRIPFQPVADLMEHLRALAASDLVLTYGDDGEKLGLWPETWEWVHERGWLADFLTALEEHRELIATALPGAVHATAPPTGRAYLPTASYDEMLAWALPAPVGRELAARREEVAQRVPGALPFLRAGLWEGFLVKYPEANQMHKRMLAVSRRVRATAARPGAPAAVVRQARLDLYRAQCNCAYWHGLFGGLYLNHLRHATYSHLIAADRALDSIAPLPAVALEDLDCDGHLEVRFEGEALTAIVAPAAGGGIVELDVKPRAFNLLNTLARWEEAYHGAVPADAGPDRAGTALRPPAFDRSRRPAFVAHLWEPGSGFDEWLRGEPRSLAALARERFSIVGSAAGRLDLLWRGGAAGRRLELRRTYLVNADRGRLGVSHTWKLLEGAALHVRFAVEINFTLLTSDAPDRYAMIDGRREGLATVAADAGVRRAVAVDEAFGFAMEVEVPRGAPPAALWRFPVETSSRGEGGPERTYQGSAWLWVFDLEITAGSASPVAELALVVKLLG